MKTMKDKTTCPLCEINMQPWTTARRTLHLNACCEKAISACDTCPGCHKSLANQVARKHLKQCASQLKMKLIDFMALVSINNGPTVHKSELKRYIPASCTAPDGTTDEDMQTAVALSLSAIEEDRKRKMEAKLGAKLHPADVGPPSHLLLSEEQRRAIFSERLATIISKAQNFKRSMKEIEAKVKRQPRRKCWSVPHLWNLASHSNTTEWTSLDEDKLNMNQFYVEALVPPLSPTTAKWGSNLYSLSQIPGRSATKVGCRLGKEEVTDYVDEPSIVQSQGFFTESNRPSGSPGLPNSPEYPLKTEAASSTIHQAFCNHSSSIGTSSAQSATQLYQMPGEISTPPQQSGNRFRSMVGETTCADSWLLLDTGDPVPVHRFVFAAWRILETVFPDRLDTAFAPKVGREELLQLLTVLYEGDGDQWKKSARKLSPSAKTLADSWGLPFIDVNLSTSADQMDNCIPIQRHQPEPQLEQAVEYSPKTASPPFPSPTLSQAETQTGTSQRQVHTPCSGKAPSVVQISPQFSRDLFSPVEDSLSENNVPMMQDQKLESPIAHISPEASVASNSPNPLFEDQPTPCPLFKRLRLSHEKSTTHTEPNSCTELIITSSSSLTLTDPASFIFTPMKFTGIDQDNGFSLEAQLSSPVRKQCTPLTNKIAPASFQSPATPLPNYIEMMTPELKRALSTYGVRPLPRKRAVKLLNEIYNQLHQYESVANAVVQPAQPFQSTSSDSQTQNHPPEPVDGRSIVDSASTRIVPDEKRTTRRPSTSIREEKEKPQVSENPSHSPVAVDCPFEVDDHSAESDCEDQNKIDTESAVLNYLEKDEELYRNILLYTPIEFDVIHAMLKSSGIKVNARKLMDILDDQCIPFTLRNRNRGQSKSRSTKVIKKRVA